MPDGQQREVGGSATSSGKPADGASPQENAAPTLSLPKGGGAINGIGEKFTANPVTGTGNLTVPIAVSPGRSGFGPSLALSYDSGAGNGPFGLGWSLSLPAITRRTDPGAGRARGAAVRGGLPRYQDQTDSDIFILSGAEDLVPTLTKDAQGNWARQTTTRNGYSVTQYRPRIEGLFSRIERWTRESDGDTFWRSISRSNVTTLYGRTPESRITDPANPLHIFSWLICESFDDKGNAISYEYVAEDSSNVDLSLPSEHNRTPASRSANRYLKRIFYGNTTPWQLQSSATPFVSPDFSKPRSWLFEVVLDYGEGHFSVTQDSDGRELATASINGTEAWPARQDPFSRYRSTFEVRTYRLCQRVLMFHHFQDELGVPDYLVRSTEFTYQQSPVASFISQVTQSGFVLQPDKSTYLRRSLPPVEFEYSQAKVDTSVRDVDPESLENLPAGVDGLRYRWLDLDGEGLQGVLAEYNDAWYYKRNLSPLSFDFVGDQPTSSARFEALAEVSKLPGFAKASAGAPRHQFLDLAGDGQLDCVVLERPTPGFYKRTEHENWEPFRALSSTPNVNFNNPNLRFMDVDGDGHADILITEDDVFTWYPSLAEAGFDSGIRVPKPRDEEQGPAIAFADFTQSIFLADMSGDGLTDIVRIRNGEICYWPNLGYGQFGGKVAMNSAPWFEAPDLFDARRIRLADIDGSGTIDIIYLSSQGVRLYFNQAGNGWSAEAPVIPFPRVDRLSDVQAVDLLGNGTACLVWTSSLPADARQVMRYVDLMGGQKPYLLTKSRNNLGAETRIRYAPSTKFYLQDRQAGRPWATRLPFPVHVVERVETFDWISHNHFVTRYRYHHGHYDGFEREFRGFGMVEQQDTEELGVLEASGPFQVSTNIDSASYVPPVLTKTWFHTGAYPHGARVSRIYESEYYREPSLSDTELAAMTLPDTVLPTDLETNEIREAIRSLKGAVLRTEVYALDATDATERPYSVSEQNYTVKRVQPLDGNRHAVFFTHARESIDFHYERTLFKVRNKGTNVDEMRADPRVTHAMVLDVDKYGNALKSAAIAYGRRFDDVDLTHALLPDDQAEQRKLHVTATENVSTNDVVADDVFRAPLPAETRTYEVVQLTAPTGSANLTNLFRFDDFAAPGALASDGNHDLLYEDVDAKGALRPPRETYRRIIEHVRTLYRADDLNGALDLGKLGSLALPYASYKLAFTPGLLSVYARNGQALLLPDPKTVLAEGGYVRSEDVFPNDPLLGHFWIPTGRVFFSPNANDSNTQELQLAQQHFFLPQRFQDPFSNSSTVTYDSHDLLLLQAEDALHNQVTVGERVSNSTTINGNNYRVLQPARIMDPNGNRAQVAFDGLGLVVGTAVLGKTTEALGDSPSNSLDDPLGTFKTDLTQKQIDDFFSDPKGQAAALLQQATTRIVYDVGRFHRAWQQLSQSQQAPGSAPPTFGATIVRETHVSDLQSSAGTSAVQVSVSYSDGFGREIQRKAQAEPGPLTRDSPTIVEPRWVASGWTIFNNKGKPVRQYEPFFHDTHDFKFGVKVGVSGTLFYDAVGRVVATAHPDHTWEKVVFDPWRQESWDATDTVLLDPKHDDDVGAFFQRIPDDDYLPTWYVRRTDLSANPAPSAEDQDAAAKAKVHAGTPTEAYADSLGRTFLTVAQNQYLSGSVTVSERLATRIAFDIEGNQRDVRDALGRIVMRYVYDMLGTRIQQASMEAGQRWTLNDVGGKAIRAWNDRLYDFRTDYDALRRPVRSFVQGGVSGLAKEVRENEVFAQEILFQRTIYGEQHPDAPSLNLRGRAFIQLDCAGAVTSGAQTVGALEAHDFKGNLLRGSRRLAQLASGTKKPTVDWTSVDQVVPTDFGVLVDLSQLESALQPLLETEIFETRGTFDALNRPLTSTAPDGSITRPTYNEANLLETLAITLHGDSTPTLFVQNIDYDAKGRRTRIECGDKSGNGAIATTEYSYDSETFRLISLTTKRVSATNDFATQIFKNGTNLQALSYTYDPVGNITQITDNALLTTLRDNAQVDPTCDYTYDAIYRLIQATGREQIAQSAIEVPSSSATLRDFPFAGLSVNPNDLQAVRTYTERYRYDGVGNILEMNHSATKGDWTRSYTYAQGSLIESGALNNALSSTTLQPNGANAIPEGYSYDAHGNMQMAHLAVMGWDFRDQLSVSQRQVVNNGTGAERTYYVYDGSGRRVRKVTETAAGGRKNERIYLGGFEVYREYSGTGASPSLERKTLHVSDGAQRVALVETKTIDASVNVATLSETLIRYQFDNYLGSAALELDGAGALISYEEYLPYGGPAFQARGTSSVEVSAKRYRYTGMERDEETGLGYHSARYYANWLGRWAACDPILISGGICLFRYCSNNPIVLRDREGLADEKPHSISLPISQWAIDTARQMGTQKSIDNAVAGVPQDGRQQALANELPQLTLTRKKAKAAHEEQVFKDQHHTFSQGLGDATVQAATQVVQGAIASAKEKLDKAAHDPAGAIQDMRDAPVQSLVGTAAGIFQAGKTFSEEFAKGALAPSDYESGFHAALAALSAMQFTASVLDVVETGKGVTETNGTKAGTPGDTAPATPKPPTEGSAIDSVATTASTPPKGSGGQTTTVIGRMADVERFAGDPTVDTWAKSGRIPAPGEPPVTWLENANWLKERVARGDKFGIATDPTTLPPVRGGYIPGTPNGYFTARELEFLRNLGIDPIPLH